MMKLMMKTGITVSHKKTLNQKGVALLFVTTSIILLTILLADFSFETQINKLRAYNSQDLLKARLNAEAGLNFSLLRLGLYQKSRNMINRNEDIGENMDIQNLSMVWSFPFIYPIPEGFKTKLAVKLAIEKFMKNSLIEGEIVTDIQNISQKINLNLLRMDKSHLKYLKKKNSNKKEENERDYDERSISEREVNNVILNLEKRLTELFRQKFDKRIEKDEEFAHKYSNIKHEILIKEIKFYINDADKRFEPETEEVRNLYRSEGITAKHAPFESLSELYLLRGWDDELVNMIKNDVTVHGIVAIDLNQITEQGLKLLIPEISDEEVKDFFEYRHDPSRPNFFNNLNDFKNYITRIAKILSPSEMNERIKIFLDAGIEFGVYGSLFQVISTGRYERSEYTIKAIVEIPIKPTAESPPQNPDDPFKEDPTLNQENDSEGTNSDQKDQKKTGGNKSSKSKEPPPVEFLPPRVVEITIY